MGLVGLLLVALGVAGLFTREVVAVNVETAALLTAGSAVVAIVGAVLILFALSRTALGWGVFPLLIGVGALVAQAVFRWVEVRAVQSWQPWVGIVLALTVAVGVVVVTESVFLMTDDHSGPALLALFAAASLVADVFFDFGRVWDDLLDVGTAVLAASFALAAVVRATSDSVDMVRGFSRDRALSMTPGWNHPAVDDARAWCLRVAVFGLGLAAVPITAIAAFDAQAWAGVLLVLVAVLGGYLAVSTALVPLLVRAVGVVRFSRLGLEAVEDLVAERWGRPAAAALGGYLVVAAVVELIVFRPAWWLVVVLSVAVVAGTVVVWRILSASWSLLVRGLVARADSPEASTPAIGKVLADLARRDAVFRLLPGSENLAP